MATIMERDRSAIVAHVPDHACTMRRMHEVSNKRAMVGEAELAAFGGQPLAPINLQTFVVPVGSTRSAFAAGELPFDLATHPAPKFRAADQIHSRLRKDCVAYAAQAQSASKSALRGLDRADIRNVLAQPASASARATLAQVRRSPFLFCLSLLLIFLFFAHFFSCSPFFLAYLSFLCADRRPLHDAARAPRERSRVGAPSDPAAGDVRQLRQRGRERGADRRTRSHRGGGGTHAMGADDAPLGGRRPQLVVRASHGVAPSTRRRRDAQAFEPLPHRRLRENGDGHHRRYRVSFLARLAAAALRRSGR